MKTSLTDAVEAFLRSNPEKWIAASEFERIGGRQGWRTRLSNCRRERGMDIENRLRRCQMPDGTKFIMSEYRFVAPREPREIDLFEEASA